MSIYREISWKLHTVDIMHSAAFRKMAGIGVLSGGRLPVISYIISNGGCTQQEVANALGVSAPAITGAVKRLERDGLITRSADSANMRCNRLYATALGEKTAQRCRSEILQADRRFYGSLSDSECAVLSEFLERIIEDYTGEKYDREKTGQFLSNKLSKNPGGRIDD